MGRVVYMCIYLLFKYNSKMYLIFFKCFSLFCLINELKSINIHQYCTDGFYKLI